MKKMSLLVVGIGLWLLIPRAATQIVPGSTNIANRVGQVILPERLLLDSSLTASFDARPLRLDLPPEVKLQLLRFEKFREAYLNRQQDLLRKMRGATDDDRARIRAQLQALRDEWLQRTRAFREEARARIRELQDELPRYREALTDARQNALDAASSSRKRRGDE
ncbi:MAG TPA: hypothetical protein VEL06_01325 [Haliangiales bacterium]|nr:hypothetical protein [Haliangiales bacterium]